jgi:hypothetical protein
VLDREQGGPHNTRFLRAECDRSVSTSLHAAELYPRATYPSRRTSLSYLAGADCLGEFGDVGDDGIGSGFAEAVILAGLIGISDAARSNGLGCSDVRCLVANQGAADWGGAERLGACSIRYGCGRERTVSLDPDTMAVLREHRGRQRAERDIAGAAWSQSDYVFTTGLGLPVPPDTVTNLMAVLIRQFNLPAIPGTRKTPRQELPRPVNPLPPARLHDLRHVHATMLLTAGVPVHVVAERLGHADPAITLRVYAHVIRKSADGVAATFAAAVSAEIEVEDQADDDDPATPAVVAC